MRNWPWIMPCAAREAGAHESETALTGGEQVRRGGAGTTAGVVGLQRVPDRSLFNSKSALFRVSFVPRLTDAERGSAFGQFILPGVIFNVGGNSVNLPVAVFVGRVGDRLAHRTRAIRRGCGGCCASPRGAGWRAR